MTRCLSSLNGSRARGIPTALRMSAYVYPIILTLHLIGIAFFGGMIFLTDLRLLGVTLRKIPAAKVIESLRRAQADSDSRSWSPAGC